MRSTVMALLLVLPSCATPPTPTQIAKWKAAAQAAVIALQTAEKITPAEADDLSKLIETGDYARSKVVVDALAKAGKITPAEARGILAFVDLLVAALKEARS